MTHARNPRLDTGSRPAADADGTAGAETVEQQLQAVRVEIRALERQATRTEAQLRTLADLWEEERRLSDEVRYGENS